MSPCPAMRTIAPPRASSTQPIPPPGFRPETGHPTGLDEPADLFHSQPVSPYARMSKAQNDLRLSESSRTGIRPLIHAHLG